jgi:DNA repair exonuclease SbcCD nuclease subunit
MADSAIKILFLGDTHLGFDLPLHPRVQRRRRGVDFFANFNKALEPALHGKVDIVLHGGDLFYRSRVPAVHVTEAFKPIRRVAEQGTPVFIVPGNHERSRIPDSLFVRHPNIHIFDRPKTLSLRFQGVTVSLSGFPYCREGVRHHFRDRVDQTGFSRTKADISLLCMHQIVEGAKVGPGDYTFRSSSDVIRGKDIPEGFAAVLSGHIHRAQVLSRDLAGNSLAAPVLYAGSVERTSIAERYEEKGYFIISFVPSGGCGGLLPSYVFVNLPTRPMVNIRIEVDGLGRWGLRNQLAGIISNLHPESVVRVKVEGAVSGGIHPVLCAESLRSLAPPTMNIYVANDRAQER